MTTGRNERRQTKWAQGPHGAFPSAACLGPNPDTLGEKKMGGKKRGKNKGLWQRGEKTDREILIVILVICEPSITAKSASECACFYIKPSFVCMSVWHHVITAT